MKESLLKLIEKEASFFEHVSFLSVKKILLVLKRNGLVLKYLENPSIEMIETALNQNGMALQYVENQTEELCLIAVKNSGRALQFVQNQTEAICRAAIDKYAPSFLYVKEQTESLSLLAVQKDCRVFRLVKEQTLDLCIEAVKRDGMLLEYVHPCFQTEEVIRLSIQQNVHALSFLTEKTPWMMFEAIKRGYGELAGEMTLDQRHLNEWIKTDPKKVVHIHSLTEEMVWTLSQHGTSVSRWIGSGRHKNPNVIEFLLWLWLLEGVKEKEEYYLELWSLNDFDDGNRRILRFLKKIDVFSYSSLSFEVYRKWYFEMLLMKDEECLKLIVEEPIRVLAFEHSRLTEQFCFLLVQANLQTYRYLPLNCRTSLISRYVISREPSFKLISPYFGENDYYV